MVAFSVWVKFAPAVPLPFLWFEFFCQEICIRYVLAGGFQRVSRRMDCLPEVVIEVVGARFVGFVAEDDARSAMVGLASSVGDEAFWRRAVRHGGIVARGRVAV